METVVELKIRKDYVRKADGCGAVYLYVRIDREKDQIQLNLHWPPSLIEKNALLPREKKDKDCHDFNLIIRQAIARANDIFVEHRLREKGLTMAEFLKLYHDYEKRKDFLAYMKAKIAERYKRGKISKGTRNSHVNTWLWLKGFRDQVAYIDLTKRFVEEFEGWLMQQKNRRANDEKPLDANTIANIMKFVRAYINLAIKDGTPIENPFRQADVKTSQDVAEVEYLTPRHVAALMDFYENAILPLGEKLTLCRFLVACQLGLRISDILRIDEDFVVPLRLTRRMGFTPAKQMRTKRRKTVYLPIDDTTMDFLNDLVFYRKQALQNGLKITEEYGRKALRKLARKSGVPITGFHMGRHSFATSFLLADGKIQNLQIILGHSSILTTMIYAHVVERDRDEEMLEVTNLYQSFREKTAMKPVTA